MKFNTLSSEYIVNLQADFSSHLQFNSIQCYNPIFGNYMEIDNNPEHNVLKNKYIIKRILTTDNIEEEGDMKKDSYIKEFISASVLNQYSKHEHDRDIFIKFSPILDVIQYLLNEYNVCHDTRLPNLHQSFLCDKINNFQNAAYIDAFFTYIGSKMTESGKAPTFPIFYGTFTGIREDYKYDITEDYSHIKFNNIFQKNKNKMFMMVEHEIETTGSSIADCEDMNIADGDIGELILDTLDLEGLDGLDGLDGLEGLDGLDGLDGVSSTRPSISDGDVGIIAIDENYMFDDIIDNNNTYKYCKFKEFPVQAICMEKMDMTLDDLIDEEDYNITDTEWKSILFQTCFGLAVGQKQCQFIHNDLHSANIMFKVTKDVFIYFNVNNKYYRIPLFGKITKIIDFGRAIFTHDNILYFSDVFDENGDADGQYDYPENNSLKNCKIKPNPSFDLARLSSTIIEHFEIETKIYKLLKTWITDRHGYFLYNDEDDFDLYKNIAKNVNNAVPIKQLVKPIFKQFIVEKKSIPKGTYIYKY